ncbi:MAG: leucine-rich repeat protein, partial [Bacteroidales bacterium]|nr:leucine-rich repeat protein [Bacteroidales bacterium]
MKTTKIFFAALALAALALSCTREAEVSDAISVNRQTVITASFEGASRTALQNGGTQIYWEPADEIKVFFKTFSGRFVSQNTELAEVADFMGSLTALVGANEGASSSNLFWGLYPFRSDAVYDGSSVTTTLPAAQTGRAGGFARNTHITLACSAGADLSFFHVCGGLRFSLTQEGIKQITFEGNGAEGIAGKIKVGFENELPVIQELTEPQTMITLTAPNGGSFETGVWYYIEAVPGALPQGYTMKFYKDGASAKLSTSSPVSFKRGKFGSLVDVDEWLIFTPDGDEPGPGDEPDPEDIIQFADPIAKYACLDRFDTNGDGEITYAEAAAATSFSGLFNDWPSVKSFEEIRFFTGVTSTENVFTGLTQLDSITIPAQITTLGTFKNCSSLKKVVLPAALSSLPQDCFSGCTALAKIAFPENLTAIPINCFQNCTALQSIVLPSKVAGIGSGAFTGCSALQTIVFPAGLTSLPASCLSGLGSLTNIVLPESLGEVPNNCFQNCSALEAIDLSSAVKRIGSSAFSGCTSLKTMLLPAALTTLNSDCFSGCRALEEITFSEVLTAIPNNCFKNCSLLESLTFPSSVSSIGSGAFSGCTALKTVILSSGLKTLPDACFSGCSALKTVIFPEALTAIPNQCFKNCTSLETITIPASVTRLGWNSFEGCTSLFYISLPENLTSLGQYTFRNCIGLTTIKLSEKMTLLPEGMFYGCDALKSIQWPSNLQAIGDKAFMNCSFKDNAYTLELPASITSIGSYAFMGLHHILIPSTSSVSISSRAFEDPSVYRTFLYVPAGKVEMYKVRTNWSEYAERIRPMGDYPVEAWNKGTAGEPVDLGLSVKWASWNVGASAPEEYGEYFAWGETEPEMWVQNYYWSTYKWCMNGRSDQLTKYCYQSNYGYNGFVDNKYTLDSEDDAATVNWGGSWRMPTYSELNELKTQCTWEWTTLNGVYGSKVTSNKEGYTNKWIFLPASGERVGLDLDRIGSEGYCWSSSLLTDSPVHAYSMNFCSNYVGFSLNSYGRSKGIPVRPVYDERIHTPVVTVNPESITEGSATPVVVAWDAVPKAGYYTVSYAGNQYTVTETSYSINASNLSADTYLVSVVAYPAATDLAPPSEPGTAIFTIKEGLTPVSATAQTAWDAAYMKAAVEHFGAGTAIAEDLVYGNLGFVSGGKSLKFGIDNAESENPLYRMQLANTGSLDKGQCLLRFIAGSAGTLKVTVRSTGDAARTMAVAIGSLTDADVKSAPGKADLPQENSWELAAKAGDNISIYGAAGAINIYSVVWTPTAGP